LGGFAESVSGGVLAKVLAVYLHCLLYVRAVCSYAELSNMRKGLVHALPGRGVAERSYVRALVKERVDDKRGAETLGWDRVVIIGFEDSQGWGERKGGEC
jgi:hypothetical protein